MEKQKKVDLFLDSGAFSAWTQKATIDIQEYIRFIKENQDVIEVYANLDVIGIGGKQPNRLTAEKTLENQRIMEKAGLHPIPCFHFGEPMEFLDMYVKEYDYLALGVAGNSGTQLIPWLDKCFSEHICDSDGMPKIKVHGFAVTSLKIMMRYPWYCMTEEDHQVLTKQGWCSRKDLKIGDQILAFKDGISLWEEILEIPSFDVINTPIKALNYRTFSARVTGNHRWRVKSAYSDKWKWKTTDELNTNCYIPRVGKYQAPINKIYSDDFVKAFAWYWTEGCIKKRKNYKLPSITISQSISANPEKVELIREILKNCKEKFCEGIAERYDLGIYRKEMTFELYGPLRDWLLSISPNKQIPMEFLLNLTEEQLHIFIDHSILADGSRGVLKRKKSFVITQGSEKNIEEFRIACLLAGYPTSVYKKGEKGLEIASSSVNYIHPNQMKVNEFSYTGKIWCVRVPSGAFFTKCNGEIYVTGNSVDSTSWVVTGRMGSIFIPRRKNGNWVYDENPWKIAVSSRSPGTEDAGKHIGTLSKAEREVFLSYIHEKGYSLGKSEFKKVPQTHQLSDNERWVDKKPTDKSALRELEVITEDGLSNRYQLRDEINIMYFLDLEKNSPAWPWAFKLNDMQKGLL
jgi:hypothetical protein